MLFAETRPVMYRHHYRSNRSRDEQQQRNLECLEFITVLYGEIGLDSMCVNVWNHSISLELFKIKHHHLIILVVFFLESFIDLVEMNVDNYYGPKFHAVGYNILC
jgi:hypothetical protein